MKCQDIEFELALYFDDILAPAEIDSIDQHLAQCPLCRASLSEHHVVRSELRAAERVTIPDEVRINLRDAVRKAVSPPVYSPTFRLVEERRNWLRVWLMPSAVGSFASLLLALTLGWLILLPISERELDIASGNSSSTVFVRSLNNNVVDGIDLSPLEYANTRLSVAGESPSVNPEGALIALSRSLVRGEMKDEEVVIVADVFGNGLAQIAEIVEPKQDPEKILELRRAFHQTDAELAPFVPARMDRRSNSVRVVLKLQSIDVPVDSAGL